MSIGVRVKLHQVADALQQDISRIEALWNEGLKRFGGPFLAGASFTAVDAFFAPVAFRAQTYGLAMNDAALAYAARLRALPSMVEWADAAVAETWRESGHDVEVARHGSVVVDLRAKA